jgi:hypothetical protein
MPGAHKTHAKIRQILECGCSAPLFTRDGNPSLPLPPAISATAKTNTPRIAF